MQHRSILRKGWSYTLDSVQLAKMNVGGSIVKFNLVFTDSQTCSDSQNTVEMELQPVDKEEGIK